MNGHAKPIVALAAAALLACTAFSPSAQAQSTMIESGNSILADVFGVNTGPEALDVFWFVVQNTSSGVYTYAYNIYNPVGDVALPGSGLPANTPETFAAFNLSFNASVPGTVVSATAPVGGTFVNNGTGGLAWTFPDVTPGNSSPLLAFQSSFAPVMGNASASGGAIPPSPWTSVNNGQQVPVPRPVPEPATMTLFGLGFALLPLRSVIRRLGRRD